MEQKATQKERVSKKYGALISYYTEVWALAYNTVSSHPVLSTLDPMGKKLQQQHCFLELVQEWTRAMNNLPKLKLKY